VAADVSGDLAYTVGYEHCLRSLDGGPVESATLRVTHIYRREDGEWKIVHRHGDTSFRSEPTFKGLGDLGHLRHSLFLPQTSVSIGELFLTHFLG
jgi:hypothetical protein